MRRAVLAIGVDVCGRLPRLRDAARGAERFAAWARARGVAAADRKLLTDGAGPVTADAVKRALRELVGGDDPPDQLLVYFAGHGVNLGYSEYWLLSDAPSDAQAAVNVAGSEVLARYCGVPHVAFFSDACRTAADTVQAQRVTGSEIFPTDQVNELENPVDQFYACTLGRPALEARDVAANAARFAALYTDALLCGLSGCVTDVIDGGGEGHDGAAGHVRPRLLKPWLTRAVPQRIAALGLEHRAIQIPDARIASEPTASLAHIAGDAAGPECTCAVDYEDVRVRRGARPPEPVSASSANGALLRAALAAPHRLDRALQAGVRQATPAAAHVARDVGTLLRAPMRHAPGFTFQGDEVLAAHAAEATVQLAGDAPSTRVDVLDARPGATVLFALASGKVALLPALPRHAVDVVFDQGELVAVGYDDPALPESQRARGASVRAVLAAALRAGTIELEARDAEALAELAAQDVALATYAAHVLDAPAYKPLLQALAHALEAGVGAVPFDLALAVGLLERGRGTPTILTPMPQLTRGWALLRARRVPLPRALDPLRVLLRPSPWTLFGHDALDPLRTALQRRELR